jgi:hypothetical protein
MKPTGRNNIIDEFKRLRLSDIERDTMRTQLVSYMGRPIVSPWYMFLRPVGVFLLILAVITGGTVSLSYASTKALPTDKLYPVKLLTEEFVLSTKKTPSEKTDYQVTRVAKRLDEAKELVNQKKLTAEVSQKIADQVKAHVAETNVSIKETIATDPKQALEGATNLETTLEVKTAELVSAIETKQDTAPAAVTMMAKTLAPAEDSASVTATIRPDTRSELANVLLTITESTNENQRAISKTKDIVVESIKQSDIEGQKQKALDSLEEAKTELQKASSAEKTAIPTTLGGVEVKTSLDAVIEVKSDNSSTKATQENLLKEAEDLYNQGLYTESLVKSQKLKSIIENKTTTQTLEEPKINTEIQKVNTTTIPSAGTGTTEEILKTKDTVSTAASIDIPKATR